MINRRSNFRFKILNFTRDFYFNNLIRDTPRPLLNSLFAEGGAIILSMLLSMLRASSRVLLATDADVSASNDPTDTLARGGGVGVVGG